MGQDRSVLGPKERARITELQDALVDRLFERDEAIDFCTAFVSTSYPLLLISTR